MKFLQVSFRKVAKVMVVVVEAVLLSLLSVGTNPGADPEILIRGDDLLRQPWLADEENFRFEMV